MEKILKICYQSYVRRRIVTLTLRFDWPILKKTNDYTQKNKAPKVGGQILWICLFMPSVVYIIYIFSFWLMEQ